MRILMRGRERTVSDKMGRTLILIGKAVEVTRPKPEPKPARKVAKRTYRRSDMVAEPPLSSTHATDEVPQGPIYPHERDE